MRHTVTLECRLLDEMQKEIERVETIIQKMLATTTNGQVSLLQRMRLSLGRVEVEAYLAGIKYAMGSASHDYSSYEADWDCIQQSTEKPNPRKAQSELRLGTSVQSGSQRSAT